MTGSLLSSPPPPDCPRASRCPLAETAPPAHRRPHALKRSGDALELGRCFSAVPVVSTNIRSPSFRSDFTFSSFGQVHPYFFFAAFAVVSTCHFLNTLTRYSQTCFSTTPDLKIFWLCKQIRQTSFICLGTPQSSLYREANSIRQIFVRDLVNSGQIS